MFDKILIANRGEIAARVARSARRLGIVSVAVYSEADRGALHVEACDEAYAIGGATAAESYLDAERILDVARQCGAQAIHPGYGFLSENAGFARACAAAGIVFIGPPASAIEAMGSKSEAKALMAKAGVPLVPGYHGSEQGDELLTTESKKVGYPQLIKASAGGGGKGMRLVESETEFAAALAAARREASAGFGDDRVLLERYLRRPRHVELQVFGDTHGNYVHLFERDCSIQRRHQKVIEEAPAPGMTDELRARMAQAALDCAAAIDYVGAGTVEFLLDEDGSFYFMEMNTRLQVEHPVTEMITGLDLVEWQLRVAAGDRLPLVQQDIGIQGHSVEARIYAEMPERDFLPASGRIEYQQLPPIGPGARLELGARQGDSIGIYYDPMIAKLIVHAPDREQALARLAQLLREYHLLGPATNIGFLERLATHPALIAADLDTGFIERHRDELFAGDPAEQTRALVFAGAACVPVFDVAEQTDDIWSDRGGWRMNLPALFRVRLVHDGEAHEVEFEHADDGWRCRCRGELMHVNVERRDRHRLRVEIDDEIFEVAAVRMAERVLLAQQARTWSFDLPDPAQARGSDEADADHPRAPMSGAVVALPVAVGDTVAAGDTLVVIEAMKMEHAVTARVAGRVGEILFAVGDQVDEGDALVTLEVGDT
ncbi:MAG: biotin carboxylase N-terminal domain-containing protein [Gammaproteobacteria bacterium]|nr:biotin carboxylase N-terminal domain-containing protein [Gammaproteobacteria bacterium]